MARYFVLLDISHRRSELWHALLGGMLDLALSLVLECLLALASKMWQTCGDDDSTVWERTTAVDACVKHMCHTGHTTVVRPKLRKSVRWYVAQESV